MRAYKGKVYPVQLEKRIEVYKTALELLEDNLNDERGLCFRLQMILWNKKSYEDLYNYYKYKGYNKAKEMFPEINVDTLSRLGNDSNRKIFLKEILNNLTK